MAVVARAGTRPCPPAIPGFQDIHRFWDPATARWTAKVLPGEFYVTRHDEAIATVLGSCISACISDRRLGVGGLNHFMLPEDSSSGASDRWRNPATGLATRYGSHAMECLINELFKLGARREHFEIKLFGGGRILASMTDVGARNAAFVREYLKSEGLKVTAEDLGDIYPRRIIYFPESGKVRVRRLQPLEATSIAERERRYQSDLARHSGGGEVELF
ncbi:MAG TPA: chemoreceptor glutamine deamidase CheD [Steroidobacteraceae bacterium]|nr:chemoreceptor glutamine deamidase CheD [Steroidobacteraceae bacterium]